MFEDYYEVPEENFEMRVTVTLCKDTSIVTNDYIPPCHDEEGNRIPADTSDVDWEKEYKEQEYTIPRLLEELKALAEEKLKTVNKYTLDEYRLKTIIRSCDGWEIIDDEYEGLE